MTPVQMNVRIDRDLKRVGDAAFEAIGYTPTEVVREMWGFAQRNRDNKRALAEMMRSLKDPSTRDNEDAEEAKRDAEFREWVARGSATVREACMQFGVNLDALPPVHVADYDELLADEIVDDYERVGGCA